MITRKGGAQRKRSRSTTRSARLPGSFQRPCKHPPPLEFVDGGSGSYNAQSRMAKGASSLKIPSLDGFRAVSILIVFMSHAGLRQIIPGTFGVTVFFFLSGYLITTLLRLEWKETDAISLRHFYLRRVLRIFPPLYLTLAFASVVTLVGLLPGTLTWSAFGAQVMFLANYYKIYRAGFGMPPGMLVLWSLAVEEHFYVGFPLLYIVL